MKIALFGIFISINSLKIRHNKFDKAAVDTQKPDFLEKSGFSQTMTFKRIHSGQI